MGFIPGQGPIAGSAFVLSGARVRPRRHIGAGSRDVILTRPHKSARPRAISPNAPTMSTRAAKRPALYITSFVLLCGASLAAVGIGATVDTPRTLMSRADYAEGRKAIEATSRQALGACRTVAVAERELCKARVRAEERIQRAELAARYHGTVAAAAEVKQARVKAGYDVARARCSSQLADDRTACLRAARDERNRALAEAAPSTT